MKTLITLLLITNSVFGQFSSDGSANRKYSIGAFGNLYYYGIYSGIEAGIHTEKHSFNLGIGAEPGKLRYAKDKDWAANFNYNYFPNGHKNRFDLLFDFNVIMGFKNYKTGFEFVQDYNLGFGFNTNLSQRFFIKPSLGTGISMYRFKFNDVSWSANARISIGYRF